MQTASMLRCLWVVVLLAALSVTCASPSWYSRPSGIGESLRIAQDFHNARRWQSRYRRTTTPRWGWRTPTPTQDIQSQFRDAVATWRNNQLRMMG
ncbi:hypothetical protein FJT64_021917 [Amphibalanus amphitrite]|uniref:Uncharacterized protein n=1 Tax=Amphibalanus amphitrite TaxID=1232801 RepID=A0A6A4WGQ1_AMPAM|nr:hypothetical protein FJT64_021917 [Amphibalanus amphitrite]